LVIEQIHRLTTKIPTDLDEALCQFIRQLLFTNTIELVGTKIGVPNFTLQKYAQFSLQKGEDCFDSVVEKAIMKMQKNQHRTRGLAAQFIDFLHTLGYQLHAGMIFTTLFLP